jgi:Na+-translocating ferredoxin:NAD+ oxidoreductase RnfC subunit
LGYAVEPHQVMRSLAFTATGKEHWNQWAALCCACGLCTLYGCPEELFPKEACDNSKAEMRQANLKWTGPMTVKPHPMRDGRRVPIKTLMKKLHIQQYDHPAHWEPVDFSPTRLVLPLKQNAGAANVPLVKPGDQVTAGQMLGQIPAKALGAPIHAPFNGRVVSVDTRVVLERTT